MATDDPNIIFLTFNEFTVTWMCWISFSCRTPEGKLGFLCGDRPMWYKHFTQSFSAIKHGIKCVSIPPPWHFRHVCGDRMRPNIFNYNRRLYSEGNRSEEEVGMLRWGWDKEATEGNVRQGECSVRNVRVGKQSDPEPPPWAVFDICLTELFTADF